MSAQQVKEAETHAKELINKNGQVYAKESTLGVAKTINGLRAVFDEVYPDPVRVVAIGVPVENLESDPFGPAGLETSIEFCGGTHLKYAGHIGDFVIASEDAIAKGIRRIVALTGPEATKALKRTEMLENRLNDIKSIIDEDKNGEKSKDNVKQIVEFTEEVAQAVIPYWKKEEIRNTLKNLKKSLDDKERANKAAIATKVVEEAKLLIESNLNVPVLVNQFQAYSNTKALDSALKQLRTLSPTTAAMFVSVDPDVKKIFLLTYVPKDAIAKGLKAIEWVSSVSSLINGKGGGKDENAQASGTNIENVKEVLETAKNFANGKLSL